MSRAGVYPEGRIAMRLTGKERALMGRIEDRGVGSLLSDACRERWNGALKLATSEISGVIWLIRGQAVHASYTDDRSDSEGMTAFESLASLRRGSFLLDRDVLPPSRSIRLQMSDLIAIADEADSVEKKDARLRVPEPMEQRLNLIMDRLRCRVPGLETLSIVSGDRVQASTASEAEERDWIGRQLRVFGGAEDLEPETLYLKRQGRLLLAIADGEKSTVLSAGGGTAPEALFWAGEEACREIHKD